MSIPHPAPENGFLAGHAALLLRSYRHWTGEALLPEAEDAADTARQLFNAPFVVVSHGLGADPCFNYGNALALQLFELTWDDFVQLPSRQSAEAVDQSQRARLLQQVTQNGFISNYQGVRISASGRRFRIRDAVVWNLVDQAGEYRGQAASFATWAYL